MIGIISDTHENVAAIERAVAMLKQSSLTHVLHLGDIISPPVLPHFEGLPMRFIFGNNDGERAGLQAKANELGFGEIGDELELQIEEKRVYAYHGTRPKILKAAIDSQQYDFVLYGHSHERRDEQIGRTRVINPGALFKAPAYTFALLDCRSGELRFIEVPKN